MFPFLRCNFRQSKREIFAQHSRIRGPGVCLRVSYEVLAQRGADIRMARGYVIWPNRSACMHWGQTSSFVLIGNVTNLLSWRWRWVQKMLFYPKFTDDRSRGRRQWIHSVTWGTCLCPDLATYTAPLLPTQYPVTFICSWQICRQFCFAFPSNVFPPHPHLSKQALVHVWLVLGYTVTAPCSTVFLLFCIHGSHGRGPYYTTSMFGM